MAMNRNTTAQGVTLTEESKQALGKLHAALCSRLLEIIESGEPIKASTYAVMVDFLRDNRITLENMKAEAIQAGMKKAKQEGEAAMSLPFNVSQLRKPE